VYIFLLFAAVDVGGTFTDAIVYDDSSNEIIVNKVLTDHLHLERCIIESLEYCLRRPSEVGRISHATTLATNALLTRSGLPNTAFITNEGFRDVLEIGRQRRPELYNLKTKRPVPLVKRKDRFTVRGRISSDGRELEKLSNQDLWKISKKLKEYDSVAIGFLNSYANPKHELAARKILHKSRFLGHIDISSDVDREYREFERFSTTVVNAVLAPLISRYLGNLAKLLKAEKLDSPVYVMNSDGSASPILYASNYPVKIIESGPAAGVLASKHLAKALSLDRVITFDMGGTTAKAGAVSNYEPDVAYEFEAAGKTHSGRSIKGSGYAVRSPFLDLAEVSAGGGTIAFVDEAGALRVGPSSAGSYPGPAAYNRGGLEPTVTDANIVLGRVNPQHLLGGKMKLNKQLAFNALETKIASKLNTSVEEAAQGIIRLVNHAMSQAISIVSVERGRDPRVYSLIAFGGAGPIHACDLAEELGITKVVVPQHAGLFSANGILVADVERNFSLPVLEHLEFVNPEEYFAKLRNEVKKSVHEEEKFGNYDTRESLDLRYVGQSYEINLPYSKSKWEQIRTEFDQRHKQLYGFASTDPIEIVNVKIRAIVQSPKPHLHFERKSFKPSTSVTRRRCWFLNGYRESSVFTRELLGEQGFGPCIIEDYDSTIIVNPLWKWEQDHDGNIVLQKGRL
jgi:N-methylhydantoinase A